MLRFSHCNIIERCTNCNWNTLNWEWFLFYVLNGIFMFVLCDLCHSQLKKYWLDLTTKFKRWIIYEVGIFGEFLFALTITIFKNLIFFQYYYSLRERYCLYEWKMSEDTINLTSTSGAGSSFYKSYFDPSN